MSRSAGSIAIELPALDAEGPVRVATWLVEPGDAVEAGDRVAEVLLPGVLVYVSAPAAGTFLRAERPAGTTASAGDVLGWIDPACEAGSC
jgi:pyruvate/2-oxoglutarate dehydrogenase complex dihydrolipoamide acyltransferase (E2) component